MALYQVSITTKQDWEILMVIEAKDDGEAVDIAVSQISEYGLEAKECLAFEILD